MIQITPRDVNIFRTLASGPAIIETIRTALSKITEKTPDDAHKRFPGKMSSKRLNIRLNQLKREKYIQSGRYINRSGSGSQSLYALTEQSAKILVQHGLNIRHMRHILPTPYMVAHELEVTEATRAIKRESAKLAYDFDMEDENIIRIKAGKAGIKKIVFPDLHITLFFTVGTEKFTREIALEIDNATRQPFDVAENAWKITRAKPGWIVLILCTTNRRMEQLCLEVREYVENGKKNAKDAALAEQYENLNTLVFFTLLADFCEKGFLGVTWINPQRKKGILAPSAKK